MTCAVTETGSAINNETMTGFRICISAEMRLRYFAKKFARLLYVVSDGWKDLGLYANSLAALETNQGDATSSATEWQVRKRSKGRPGCCKYDSNFDVDHSSKCRNIPHWQRRKQRKLIDARDAIKYLIFFPGYRDNRDGKVVCGVDLVPGCWNSTRRLNYIHCLWIAGASSHYFMHGFKGHQLRNHADHVHQVNGALKTVGFSW